MLVQVEAARLMLRLLAVPMAVRQGLASLALPSLRLRRHRHAQALYRHPSPPLQSASSRTFQLRWQRRRSMLCSKTWH